MFRRFAVVVVATALLALGAVAAPPAAIHQAAAKGDLAAVQALLKVKPSLVNARDETGATPLHYAVAGGHGSVAEYLIAHKANVNAKKPDGVTPLHVAAALGHRAVAEMLIAHKADVNAVDKKGRTPLALAQANGHEEVAALLRAKGAVSSPATAKPTGKPATAKPAPAGDLKALSIDLLRRMDRGDFASTVKRLDATMAAGLSEAQLRQMWGQLTSQAGAFQMQDGVRQQRISRAGKPVDVVIVPVRFGQTRLNAQFAYDASGRIAGLYFLNPAATP